MKILSGVQKAYLERDELILRCFSPGSLERVPHEYREYGKGEFMQTPDTAGRDFMIVFSGRIIVYFLQEDGHKESVSIIERGETVGQLEMLGHLMPFFAEVVQPVQCLYIPSEICRERLFDDNIFLRYLMRVIAQEFAFSAKLECATTDIDNRVLFYMLSQTRRQIDNIEDAVHGLRCSRSSLQRSLSRLIEEGKVEKVGKGAYRIK